MCFECVRVLVGVRGIHTSGQIQKEIPHSQTPRSQRTFVAILKRFRNVVNFKSAQNRDLDSRSSSMSSTINKNSLKRSVINGSSRVPVDNDANNKKKWGSVGDVSVDIDRNQGGIRGSKNGLGDSMDALKGKHSSYGDLMFRDQKGQDEEIEVRRERDGISFSAIPNDVGTGGFSFNHPDETPRQALVRLTTSGGATGKKVQRRRSGEAEWEETGENGGDAKKGAEDQDESDDDGRERLFEAAVPATPLFLDVEVGRRGGDYEGKELKTVKTDGREKGQEIRSTEGGRHDGIEEKEAEKELAGYAGGGERPFDRHDGIKAERSIDLSDREEEQRERERNGIDRSKEANDDGLDAPKPNRPYSSPFFQQNLARWQEPLSPFIICLTLFCSGVGFLLIGVLVMVASNQSHAVVVTYDGHLSSSNGISISTATARASEPLHVDCGIHPFDTRGRVCNVSFSVDRDLTAPVHVFYMLTGFFQNYNRYATGHSVAQLSGKSLATSGCDEFKVDADGRTFYPCGLAARSIFNDSFELLNDSLALRTDGVAWGSDRDKYHNVAGYPSICGTSAVCLNSTAPKIPGILSEGVQNERFMVWNRISALPDFMKVYGRIDRDLPKGTRLAFRIRANFPVSSFRGSKSLVLATNSWIGGRNIFLGVAYLFMACLSIVTSFLFALKQCICPRELGSADRLMEFGERKRTGRRTLCCPVSFSLGRRRDRRIFG